MSRTIAVSVNNSWNLTNFRIGLLSHLIEQGFQIVALTPPDTHSAQLADLGIQHVPIKIDSQGLSPVRDARLFGAYWRVLRRLGPAAFLGWTIKPNIYGSLAAHMLGIPVINNVSGLGTAFIRTGPLTYLVSGLYRLAFVRSSTVFFQNAEDRLLFVNRGLVDLARAVLLPGSGIDTSRFAPTAQVRADQPFTFLMVARLIRDKGVVEFVEAARALRARHPSVRFDILGELEAANRTAIARADLEHWVSEGLIRYRGHAADVRPFMQEADCVVLPSYREGMPRALLEAAALGKPLIATDVPGCREIARPGRNALLCTAADAESLATAMEAMIALPDERRCAMGAEGRNIAVKEFDERVVIQRYMQALDRAMRPSPPAETR